MDNSENAKEIIRQGTVEDLDTINSIVFNAYSHYVEVIGSNPAPLDGNYLERIRDKSLHVLEVNGVTVGFIVIYIDNDALLIENVAVDTAYQGKGYGSKLIRFAEDFATKEELKSIILYTHELMTKNIEIYAKMGYIFTHRSEFNGLKRIHLKKGLSQTSKAQEAVNNFNNGCNCSQSVFITYCERFGLDKELALKLSCGLGAGMGRQGQTCGAVTGAYLVIGLKHGKVAKDDNEAKETTYRLVQEFSNKFTQRNKTTNCWEILGQELMETDTSVAAEKIRLMCPKMVNDAVEILEEVLGL